MPRKDEDTLTKTDLKQAASDLDIPGRSSMDTTELAEAIVEAVQPALAAPAASELPEQPEFGQLPRR